MTPRDSNVDVISFFPFFQRKGNRFLVILPQSETTVLPPMGHSTNYSWLRHYCVPTFQLYAHYDDVIMYSSNSNTLEEHEVRNTRETMSNLQDRLKLSKCNVQNIVHGREIEKKYRVPVESSQRRYCRRNLITLIGGKYTLSELYNKLIRFIVES